MHVAACVQGTVRTTSYAVTEQLMPEMLPAAELREMRQKADRDKKDEAELASSMQRVEAEVG